MSIYLFVEPTGNGKAKVLSQVYQGDILTEQEKAAAIQVDTIPDAPITAPGESFNMIIDIVTKEISYEKYERPLTTIEVLKKENADLKSQIDIISGALDAIIMGG